MNLIDMFFKNFIKIANNKTRLKCVVYIHIFHRYIFKNLKFHIIYTKFNYFVRKYFFYTYILYKILIL